MGLFSVPEALSLRSSPALPVPGCASTQRPRSKRYYDAVGLTLQKILLPGAGGVWKAESVVLRKITFKKIVSLAFTSLALLPVLFFLYIVAALAWIAYRPLPPIPNYGVRYTITEAGSIGSVCPNFHARDSSDFGVRLTATGQVVHPDEAALDQDKAERQDEVKAQTEAFNLPPGEYVSAVADSGDSVVVTDQGWQLWRQGRPKTSLRHSIRGYDWKPRPLILGFYRMNARDEVIGNGRIATAYASSGGLSDPHGRWLPLIWRGTGEESEDLNGCLDRASGWYVDRAVDINASGQILCLGRRTDLKGAESYPMEGACWLILTPTQAGR